MNCVPLSHGADSAGLTPAAGWRVLAGSATGSAHRRHGRGNEDAWLAASRADGTLLLAVADGAGSASHAAFGAQLAVARAITLLAQADVPAHPAGWTALLHGVLAGVRSALSAAAEARGISAGDCACTLLCLALTPSRLAALQVGDGAIVVRLTPAAGNSRRSRDNAGALLRLLPPRRGRHAGETTFVTSSGVLEQAQIGVLEPARLDTGKIDTGEIDTGEIDAVALFSDGLEPLATDLRSGAPYAPFFTPLLAFAARPDRSAGEQLAELNAFLSSRRVDARSDDDRTLVLAVRR